MRQFIQKILPLLFISEFVVSGHAQSITSLNGKFGLKDRSGNILLENDYNYLSELEAYGNYHTYVYVYQKDKLFGLYNSKNGKNTGLVFDEILPVVQDAHFLLRTGDKWGFLIEPEMHAYDWVMPKYDKVIGQSDGLNPFIPDPYEYDFNNKGFSVRQDSLWGYASYHEDKLIMPCQFRNKIEKYHRSSGTLYVSNYPNSNAGVLIHRETFASIEVSDVVMTKNLGDYYFDDYYVDDSTKILQVYNLRTGKKIYESNVSEFGPQPMYYSRIAENIASIVCTYDSDIEKQVVIWIDLNTGKELLRMPLKNCRELKYDDETGEGIVWQNVTCGARKPKRIGTIKDGKFYKE